MASSTGQSVIRHLRRAAAITDNLELPDAELLGMFIARRDEGAFAALVRRHGPMVLAACRRIIGDQDEVDDAFQATFIVLARKAGSIVRQAPLANWLYGVACRCALEARTRMIRRNSTQKPLADFASPTVEPGDDNSEVLALLDRELNRLPEKLRVPVVLCELEGRGRKEVAKFLGIAEGTLSSRLAAARKTLAQRLARRGIAVSAAGIGLALSQGEAPAAVSAALIDSTVAAAVSGKTVPTGAAALVKGVVTAMFVQRLQRVAVALIIVAAGSGLIAVGVKGGKSADAKPIAIASTVPALLPDDKPQATAEAEGQLAGGWKLVQFTADGKVQHPEGQIGLQHIYFTKDKGFFLDQGKPVAVVTYKADRSQKPAQIDLEAEGKPEKLRGIFEISEGQLKLCMVEDPKAPRPTEFESKADSKIVLLVLKRDKELKLPDEKEATKWATDAAARMVSQNNLKQIGIAMHNYHESFGALPAHAIYSKEGKPLLSWRVAILPYLDQDELYKEFHLDEPWDSEHNRKLLDKMPKVYGVKGNETHYRVFVGKGAAFEGKEGTKFSTFTDGLSNTILMIEGPDTVPWTKPDDYEYDPKKPLPKLGTGKPFKNGINVAIADESVRMLPNNIAEKTLRAAITRNGGENIDLNESEPKKDK
jgi:RNA polymerase sigma factor (sigma-70 family)